MTTVPASMTDSEKKQTRIRRMSRWGLITLPLSIFLGVVLGAIAGAVLGHIRFGISIGAGLGVGIGISVTAALFVFRSLDPPDSQ